LIKKQYVGASKKKIIDEIDQDSTRKMENSRIIFELTNLMMFALKRNLLKFELYNGQEVYQKSKLLLTWDRLRKKFNNRNSGLKRLFLERVLRFWNWVSDF
jgi:hypothetical protein